LPNWFALLEVAPQRKFGIKACPEVGKEPDCRKAQAIALFGPVGIAKQTPAAELSNGLRCQSLRWSLSHQVDNARKVGVSTVTLPEGGPIT
jgi:hypothetical protein